jgi:hypothetical protein
VKPETADAAWNRYVQLWKLNRRKSENHKVQLDAAMQYVGATRFRFGLLPDELKRKVKTNILRGYAVARNGNVFAWTQMVLRACPVEHVKVGYICRQYMELYVDTPSLSQGRYEFGKQLQALCGVTGKVQSQHMRFNSVDGWLKINSSAAWSDKTAEAGARYKEVRLFVDTEMKKTLAKRQRVVAWFESGPEVLLPFKALM